MSTSERNWQSIDPRLRQDWRQVSDEEWRARHEEYKRAIAEIDAQDDTPEEVYDAVMRGIDEARRFQGRAPAYEGQHEVIRSVYFPEGIVMSTQPQATDPQVPLSLPGESAETAAAVSGPTASDDRRAAEWPYRDVDPRTGRLRHIPSEELQARYEELRRLLAEIDAQDDTPEEVYDAVMRGIDEERRIQGRPPAFEGYY
ncbi:MAG: hypothetical protein ACYC61_30205 [Isosphaeraceae bacterium]